VEELNWAQNRGETDHFKFIREGIVLSAAGEEVLEEVEDTQTQTSSFWKSYTNGGHCKPTDWCYKYRSCDHVIQYKWTGYQRRLIFESSG